MIDYYPALIPGVYYHIYNRGNNRENIFYKEENYYYFLGKYSRYLSPLLDTYAYCLLPNHFHLLIRVKAVENILAWSRSSDLPGFLNLEGLSRDSGEMNNTISKLISTQFRLFFMSYAKAINKQQERSGSLFQKNFKRLEVKSGSYFMNLVLYIHANPQLHGFWDDHLAWPHSSFPALLSEGKTKIQRADVINRFGGKTALVAAHKQYLNLKEIEHLMLED